MDIESFNPDCATCGTTRMVPFINKSLTVGDSPENLVLSNLSGWECHNKNCKEIVFDVQSANVYSKALDDITLIKQALNY